MENNRQNYKNLKSGTIKKYFFAALEIGVGGGVFSIAEVQFEFSYIMYLLLFLFHNH